MTSSLVARLGAIAALSAMAAGIDAAAFARSAHAEDAAASQAHDDRAALSDLSDEAIFDGDDARLRLQSLRTRVAYYSQHGSGFQSQASNNPLAAGSERALITEPVVEAIFTQGSRITHRVAVPADVVTAASPDANDKYRPPDTMSQASRLNKAIALDWTAAYRALSGAVWSVRNVFHIESMYRSWTTGMGAEKGIHDEQTVFAANVQQVSDWFDIYTIQGYREGHATRSASNANISVTHVLTPTTVVHANYGVTVQQGELSNTWNSVPLMSGIRGKEFLPQERQRHALVVRAAQWLPWNGALKGFARVYVDDWGIAAATFEGALYQRISPQLYIRGNYRFHAQTGASFFSTDAPVVVGFRTADSDLAPLSSQDLGGKAVLDLPLPRSWAPFARELHVDLGFDRYWRTNDLTVSLFSCGAGFRFF